MNTTENSQLPTEPGRKTPDPTEPMKNPPQPDRPNPSKPDNDPDQTPEREIKKPPVVEPGKKSTKGPSNQDDQYILF